MATIPERTRRLYRAENLITDPWTAEDLADFQAEVDRIQASAWWKSWGSARQPIVVRRGRSQTYAAFARPGRDGKPASISVSGATFGPTLIAHELAHLACYKGGHGPWFVDAFYQLLAVAHTSEDTSGENHSRCGKVAQFEYIVGLERENVHPGGQIPRLACLVGEKLAEQLKTMTQTQARAYLDGLIEEHNTALWADETWERGKNLAWLGRGELAA